MTPHFSLSELTQSDTAIARGIDNTPTQYALQNLHYTAASLERLRAFLDARIIISSAYRSIELNKAVGGSKDSQHCRGEAVDFTAPDFGTPKEICIFLSENMDVLGIDQLIYERSWVHVSFTLNPRYQVLTAKDGGFVPGIV